MNREGYYLVGKLLAAAVTAVQLFETADTDVLIIRMLVLCCLFALQILFSQLKKTSVKKCGRLCQTGAIFFLFYMGAEQFLPILTVTAMELLDNLVSGSLFYEIGGVGLAFLWLVYKPDRDSLLFSITLITFLAFLRHLENKRRTLWETTLEQRKSIARLQEKLEDTKKYSRTIQEVAVMEERNRFAARIHDKLGHNISGSIILLEATALSVGKDPQGAKENIGRVTENLRRGVDEIRMALREERPARGSLGIQEIRKTLEEFQVTYGRKTVLETEGDLEKISAPVWVCMQENLKEALTNMLKHSEGNTFTLRVNGMNRAVRAEYADNGSCTESIVPGMGLNAIEERTAACGGTAVFQGGQGGFRIITVFM